VVAAAQMRLSMAASYTTTRCWVKSAVRVTAKSPHMWRSVICIFIGHLLTLSEPSATTLQRLSLPHLCRSAICRIALSIIKRVIS
jgi:hypothetical protein